MSVRHADVTSCILILSCSKNIACDSCTFRRAHRCIASSTLWHSNTSPSLNGGAGCFRHGGLFEWLRGVSQQGFGVGGHAGSPHGGWQPISCEPHNTSDILATPRQPAWNHSLVLGTTTEWRTASTNKKYLLPQVPHPQDAIINFNSSTVYMSNIMIGFHP